MKVHLGDVVELDLEDLAHRRRARALAGGGEILDLDHRHVPAHSGAGAVELTRRGLGSRLVPTGETTSKKVSPIANTAFSRPK